MEEGKDWTVREGNEEDLDRILSLRKVVFGGEEEDKLDPRYWKWQFMEGTDGKGLIYIIEIGGRIVGHFADIPRRFSVHGKERFGTLSLDLMVHPDYRRRGFFSRMGRYGSQCVRNRDGHFMTAYPIRRETIQGFEMLGWKVVQKLPVFVYPIRFQGIVNRYLRIPFLSLMLGGFLRGFYSLLFFPRKERGVGGEIEMDEGLGSDERFDRFWQKAQSLFPIMGVRSRSYLTWRYLLHPTRSYAIFRAMKGEVMMGYIVLRKVELLRFNSAVIVDLLALEDDVLFALIERGIEYSRSLKTDLVGCMLPEGHPYTGILRRAGFLLSPRHFLFMVYPCKGEESLLRSRDWYVNWGDTDVI